MIVAQDDAIQYWYVTMTYRPPWQRKRWHNMERYDTKLVNEPWAYFATFTLFHQVIDKATGEIVPDLDFDATWYKPNYSNELYWTAQYFERVAHTLFDTRSPFRKQCRGGLWWMEADYYSQDDTWRPHIHAILCMKHPYDAPFEVRRDMQEVIINAGIRYWDYLRIVVRRVQPGRENARRLLAYSSKPPKGHSCKAVIARYKQVFPPGYVRYHPFGMFRTRRQLPAWPTRTARRVHRLDIDAHTLKGKFYVSSLDRELNKRAPKDAPWRSRQQRLM